MNQQQGLFQMDTLFLFSNAVPPGFNELLLICASPDMVVIDQLNLIEGERAFSHCGFRIYGQTVILLKEILGPYRVAPVNKLLSQFRFGTTLDEG